MNKYLIRGLMGVLLGIALCLIGLSIMDAEPVIYKGLLITGVIVFGAGFLTIVYRFIRKIERRSILDDRKERQTNHD